MAPIGPLGRAGYISPNVYSRKSSCQVHPCQPAQKHKHIPFIAQNIFYSRYFCILLLLSSYDPGYFFIITGGVFQYFGSTNCKFQPLKQSYRENM